ncbi:hypothetical protein OIU79_002126 [Salix purpurea]|uniref:Uncharacterized protein n=1 Tax=Salix purpurea TaxID=77065 RepID=A0A9Q0URX7_SALPP|nr:hypothetical protein OIU79_002126 [Salix purpurea]
MIYGTFRKKKTQPRRMMQSRAKTRCRVRRVVKPKASKRASSGNGLASIVVDKLAARDELNRCTSHDSSVSHQSELAMVDGESKESGESMVSEETAEASLLFPPNPESKNRFQGP